MGLMEVRVGVDLKIEKTGADWIPKSGLGSEKRASLVGIVSVVRPFAKPSKDQDRKSN
jgi:hypothetical protein